MAIHLEPSRPALATLGWGRAVWGAVILCGGLSRGDAEAQRLPVANPPLAAAETEVWLAGESIGLTLSAYPRLVPVPGYAVYYQPGGRAYYFFYEGAFWFFRDQRWYRSRWYSGPWQLMWRDEVPLFLLRVPLRYYPRPPDELRGGPPDTAPRWDEHWGQGWQALPLGWQRWNRRTTPPAGPLPAYQRRYAGSNYPHDVALQARISASEGALAPGPVRAAEFSPITSGPARLRRLGAMP